MISEYVSGALNVAGVTIPGIPFVVIGHNERIGWGLTNKVRGLEGNNRQILELVRALDGPGVQHLRYRVRSEG